MSVIQKRKCAALRCAEFFTFRSVCSLRPPLWRLAILLTAISLVLLTVNRAWAFEALSSADSETNGAVTTPLQWTTSSPRPATVDDQCLQLLKSNHIDSNASAMDQDRHNAGQSAGFGFVLGIRFALDSDTNNKTKKRSNSSHLDIWQPGVTGDPHALAVAEYNRCKSDAALKALNDDWRWSR